MKEPAVIIRCPACNEPMAITKKALLGWDEKKWYPICGGEKGKFCNTRIAFADLSKDKLVELLQLLSTTATNQDTPTKPEPEDTKGKEILKRLFTYILATEDNLRQNQENQEGELRKFFYDITALVMYELDSDPTDTTKGKEYHPSREQKTKDLLDAMRMMCTTDPKDTVEEG